MDEKIVKTWTAERVGTVIVIFLLTFLVKIPFLLKIITDPIFQMPVIDSLEFDQWAYAISRGQWLWTELSNHTPLYAYFVALIYAVVGYSPASVAVTQYVLFSASTVLAYLIAEKLFNRTTAIITAILMTSYGFFIYLQTFIYSENLSIFLNLLLIVWLIFRKRNPIQKYVVAGILMGLSVLCRPEIFFFAVVIIFLMKSEFKAWKNIAKPYAAFWLGLVLILSPVALRNHAMSGEWLLRTQFGANLYIGNNPQYKGTNAHIEIGRQWEEFISLPCKVYRRNVTEGESNRYFISETLKTIRTQPGAWATLIASKIFSVWTGREFLRTEDVYVFNRYIVGTAFGIVSTSLIFILAVPGMIVALMERKRIEIILFFLLASMSIIFFPIKTRYLMTFSPFLLILASYAVYCLFAYLKAKKIPAVMITMGGIVILWALSLYNPLGVKPPDESETFYAIAKNYAARGLPAKAAEAFLITLQINPNNAAACNDFGVLLMNAGQCDKAIPYFERSMNLDSSQKYPGLNRDLCIKKMGRRRLKRFFLKRDKPREMCYKI